MGNKNIAIVWNNPLETWKQCGGYHKCPKDEKGQRIGPIVGYAPTAQYTQDYPYLISDIASGNIAWKPKDVWKMLMSSMEQQGGRQCAE